MRALDWSATLLGQPDAWPQSLTTLVRVMLSSRQPMFIAWGTKRVLLYNDGYAPMLGARDADALARPFFDVWPEVREEVGALMDEVFAGRPVHMDDLQLTLNRNGYPEETHFAFSYTPVLGEDGTIDGLFSPCTETTRQVFAERAAALTIRNAERYRIWQVSRDMLLVSDMEGRWLSVNPSWTRVLGWEEEELLGRTSEWMEHPDDQAKTRSEVGSLAAGGTTFEFENRFRTKDDDYRTLSWTAVLAGDRIYASARDVTEERKGLVALRERDALWQLSRDMMLRCTFDGTMTAVNPAWTDVLGWSEDELLGANLFDFIHPDDMAHTAEGAHELSRGIGHARFDNRYRHKDGSYRWIAWSTRSADGQINASGRDFTVEKQQAEALKDFEDFARLALRSVGGVGVWTYDVASERFKCDAAISELYGLNAERGAAGISRQEFLSNVHPDDTAKLRAVMAGGLKASGDLELEYRIRHPDGLVRWVLSRGHTYFDDAGKPVRRTGVGIETTKQRQLEEALRQSQKMEAVGQLTGGLAHDFNNLLAGISGSLEMMQARTQQGRYQDTERYLLAAQSGAKRAASLTHRLLAFSRRQTLDPKPTDVNRLVGEMQELIQRTVGPGIPVEVVGASGLWPALVDPSQLENAVLNLCINARDAMPDGGRITVETANRWMDERAAQQRDLSEGQYLSVCVTDTGSGISPELIEKVFEPFFTTKPIGEGTGLGLSMVYGFARQSGGQVRIYSEVGTGTTVCIYLPRHYGEVAKDEEQSSSTASAKTTEGKTVLVVEDEPLVRMLVTDTLEDLGYAAIEAGDSAAGLRILQSDVRIDLLVSDVGLPGGMNGRQMADAARLVRPGLKVLFVTGYAENAVVGNGHMMPGMAVITKPFQMDQLAARIRSMVEA